MVRFEKRYVDARGDSVWVEMSGSVLRDDTGRPQYFMGMVQDLGERRVAHTLQRSMLTTQLPAVDGVELAVRYLPGTRQTEISGDWYDVIPLPDGRVGVVIGDVVGRGIEAAATMSPAAHRAARLRGRGARAGRGRREAAPARRPPARRPEHDARVPGLRPVHARGALRQRRSPAGAARAGRRDAAAFCPARARRRSARRPPACPIPQERIVLAPGDGVLLYTDGLVERRDDGIDSRLQQLRAAVAEAPADLAAALEHLTATLVGDETLRQDDVALLALRVTQTGDRDVRRGDRAARRGARRAAPRPARLARARGRDAERGGRRAHRRGGGLRERDRARGRRAGQHDRGARAARRARGRCCASATTATGARRRRARARARPAAHARADGRDRHRQRAGRHAGGAAAQAVGARAGAGRGGGGAGGG